jgi:hypothetical protein
MILAVLIALPALVALTVAESAPAPAPSFRDRLFRIASEIRALIRSPRRRWGAVLLISPVGTGAAMGLCTCDRIPLQRGRCGRHVGERGAGPALLAFGALCGTLIPGDRDRRLTYTGAAFTNAFGTLVLITANRPSTYFIGTTLYLLTNGFVWARFVALLVEVVGAETMDASTFLQRAQCSRRDTRSFHDLVRRVWLQQIWHTRIALDGCDAESPRIRNRRDFVCDS